MRQQLLNLLFLLIVFILLFSGIIIGSSNVMAVVNNHDCDGAITQDYGYKPKNCEKTYLSTNQQDLYFSKNIFF
ncbi:MAG: hypothetical protein QXG00_05160 [Candidatus Woesearchaeota archaeon]